MLLIVTLAAVQPAYPTLDNQIKEDHRLLFSQILQPHHVLFHEINKKKKTYRLVILFVPKGNLNSYFHNSLALGELFCSS